MASKKLGRLISFSGFARMKGVHRTTVTDWVKDERIIPTEVGDKRMIDLDRYEAFDSSEIPKGRPIEKTGLQKIVRQLEKENAELKEKLVGKK